MEESTETRLAVIKVRAECEKELNALRAEMNSMALKLQAVEHERRLQILNNEAAQLKSMQATYLPREVFENFRTQEDQRYQQDQSWKADIKGRMTATAALVGIGFAALQIILRFWK